MRVRIEGELFAGPRRHDWSDLDAIVDLFGEGRHRWEIDDLESIDTSGWLNEFPAHRRSLRNREVFNKYVVQGAYQARGQPDLHVGTASRGRDHLTPAAAREALHAPVWVVVENDGSDGRFLAAMIEAFERNSLRLAGERRWWTFDHAGGKGEIPRVVRRRVDGTPGPIRILVLADSDRLHPGHESDTLRTLARLQQEHPEVRVFALAKRESENYLPLPALQRRDHHGFSRFKAYCRLTRVQQDFFDLKKGFRSRGEDGLPSWPPEQDGLFAALRVQPQLREGIRGGFGDDVGRLFDEARDQITRATVAATCEADPGEIERLLDRLEELL